MPFADTGDGSRIYYEITGQGDPLLMIPGFGSTTLVYWANIPELSKHLRVIAFDPRGCGRSDTPSAASMRMYVDDCVTMMDIAGVDTAHVFGASWGGMVAQNLALTYPQRVRRLVLACTTPGGANHVPPPAENMARFMASAEMTDPIMAVRSLYPLHYSDEYVEAHDEEIVARSQANAALRSKPEGRLCQLAAVQQHDTLDRLSEISAPTFVAHGEADGVVPVENGRKIAANVPGATLKIFPRAKHIFFTECAGELNRDIVEFIDGNGSSRSAHPRQPR